MTSIRKMKRRQVYHHVSVRRCVVKIDEVADLLLDMFPKITRLEGHPDKLPGHYSSAWASAFTAQTWFQRISARIPNVNEQSQLRWMAAKEGARNAAICGAVDRLIRAIMRADIFDGKFKLVTGSDYAKMSMRGENIDNVYPANSLLLAEHSVSYNEISFYCKSNCISFWVR